MGSRDGLGLALFASATIAILRFAMFCAVFTCLVSTANECVIGEPARLSEAQIIVQENPRVLPMENGSNSPTTRNVLDLNLPPERAARLSIYRVQDGNVEEVFRQTQVEAYPLLPVLLLGPVFTGEGGIGISEGFLRRHRVYAEYNLRDVLKSKLGLDFVPISR